jgi:chemotaxis methyl-accepting protein methylase
LQGVEIRAVAVKPQIATRVSAEDMDVVTETADNPAGPGFDLVVSLHSLASFDNIEQTLALESIAEMMNVGGLFLVDAPLSAVVPAELQPLGVQHVAFTDRGEGHDIAAYRRK